MPRSKWYFAIGTTSRVPGTRGLHYLILDFDNVTFHNVFKRMETEWKWVAQPTQNGWHVYTQRVLYFAGAIVLAKKLGADPAWLRIGQKRGYLFLADKSVVPLSWPVERMVIARCQTKNPHRRILTKPCNCAESSVKKATEISGMD